MDRERFTARLAKSTSPRVRHLAEDLARGACWGNLADAWDGDQEDRVTLWRALVEAGDREPLLLFLWLHRDDAAAMQRAATDAPKLPSTVQCMLVCLGANPAAEALHPAARELRTAPPGARALELAMYAAHAETLRAHRIPEETK